MNEKAPKISSQLSGSAYGAMLAMLPMTLLILVTALDIIKNLDGDIIKVIVILQFVGCLIWAALLTGSIGNAKRLNVSAGGLGMCIAGVLIGGVLQMIFTFDEKLSYKFFSIFDGEASALVLCTLLTLIVNLPIAIGAAKIGKSLPSMRKATGSYILLGLMPVIVYLLGKIAYESHKADTVRLIGIIFAVIFTVTVIVAISAWFGAAKDARDVEKDAENGEGDFAPEAYVEQNTQDAQATYSRQSDAPHQQPAPSRQAIPVTEEQKRILMSMTNAELTNVINHPALYANPAFVEEAKKTLTKREGWEVIKDFTDEQLINVVHENVQGFSPEVLDAASMELLSRENPEFMNEVTTLSTGELQGILSNPDSYYDGYVVLATRVLDQRLNAGTSAGSNPGA